MIENFRQLSFNTKNPYVQQYGHKANSLIELMALGLPVPNAWGLSTMAYDSFIRDNQIVIYSPLERSKEIKEFILEGNLSKALCAQLEKCISFDSHQTYAIRSSGVLEDMPGASFAGLYESFLYISNMDDLVSAIKRCYASVFDPRVIRYCQSKRLSLDHLKMSVIIQEMVHAQASGVTFSLDPVKGHDTTMLIEAIYGVGEYLVSGQATPDRYRYDWYNEQIKESVIEDKSHMMVRSAIYPFIELKEVDTQIRNRPVLSENQIKQLGQMVLEIQTAKGFPVDVEWAIENNNLYILQSRPITCFATSGISGQWTTADFKDGGVSSAVCSSYMWSLYQYIWNNTLPQYLNKVGLISKKQLDQNWGQMFWGRPFWNAGEVKKGLRSLPGFNEVDFDKDLGVETQEIGWPTSLTLKGLIKGINVLFRLDKSFKKRINENLKTFPVIQNLITSLLQTDFKKMNDHDLFDTYKAIVSKHYFLVESSYFNHIFDNSNVKTLFKESLDKWSKKYHILINQLDLIKGLTDLSHLRATTDLWNISRMIRSNDDALHYWLTSSSELLVANFYSNKDEHLFPVVRQYVETYKYKSAKELDITVPCIDEDPGFLIKQLLSYLVLENAQGPQLRTTLQHQQFCQTKDQFLSALPFRVSKKVSKKIEQMRTFLWWREELRNESTKMYYILRKITLEVGHRLVKNERLTRPDDLFDLPWQSVIELIKNNEIQRHLSLMKKNKQYYMSFKNFTPPMDFGNSNFNNSLQSNPVSFDISEELDASFYKVTGIACGPGKITGRVRVIHSIDDINLIQQGEILVTKFTDPAWTPVFGLISGVITETGGVLSHAAVISREYGIPSVLAVKNATQIFQSGDEILLNGHEGMIYRQMTPL